MSSPEVEAFEVTEEDLADEFNPSRKRFRATKHQATYGIWADEDSDDDRPAFGGKKKSKDFTAPVSFVSGGVKVGDKVSKTEAEEDEITDSDEEPPSSSLPSSFGAQKAPRKRGSAFVRQRQGLGGGQQKNLDSGLGGWEAHTKGIGQKLMAKMGFQSGKGLGKNQQGITTPVMAQLRKGKGTIGFYGSERTERSLIDYPRKADSDEEEEEKFKEKLSQWKKGEAAGKKKKPKYVYKTADEVVATGGKKKTVVQSELSKVKVIDMTGREKRVLSGYHAISHRHDKPEEEEVLYSKEKRAFDMPELLHNLDLLVNMAEDEILQNNKKLQYEKDLVVNLGHEKEKLDQVVEQEVKQMDKLKQVLDIVERCEARLRPDAEDPLTLDACAELLTQLQNDFYEEYKIYDLASLAVALVFPLMKKMFLNWEPLRHPHLGIETIKQWRRILEDPNKQFSRGQGHMEPYERLIWDCWMPHIRNTVQTKWSARDSDSLIELLETWLHLLPGWIMSNVLDAQVLPRLQKEVDEWNPLTDTMPIHAWLHPWLPLMGERLEPLFAPIRNKLANALTNWHPSDPSAKMILQPWNNVWQKGHMDAFLLKNISPKLTMCLQEFTVNPHNQHLDPFTWVLNWHDMLPLNSQVALLERHFFPKWHNVLSQWLVNNPNFDEVTKWFTGWKSMFPEQLVNHPTIHDEFNKGLNTMNRAVTAPTVHYQPGARENVAYLTSTERRREYDAQAAQEKRDMEAMSRGGGVSTVSSSFKELIERKAEENGIVFMPIPNKTWEAKQVYKFGRVQIYIDRGVIFMLENGMWRPVSLNNLVAAGT